MSELHNVTDIQLAELTDLINRVHGFDFSNYSKASLKRRLSRIIMLKKISFPELCKQLSSESNFFQWFLEEVTVNVTEMFRDPSFFKALRAHVVPELARLNHIRIW